MSSSEQNTERDRLREFARTTGSGAERREAMRRFTALDRARHRDVSGE